MSTEGTEQRPEVLFERVLQRLHLTRPADLATVLAGEARHIGCANLVVYVVDYEQENLVPVPTEAGPARDIHTIEGTMIGRCYATIAILETPAPDARIRLYIPLLDGTERIGAIEMTVDAPGGKLPPDVRTRCVRYAHFVAQAIATKSAYGDTFERLRRRRPMTVASELVWRLLPPRTFGTDDVVISGLVEPCYDLGGDAYDYAVNESTAHLAVLDGMGHGLTAAGLTSFALSAYRQRRVHGDTLSDAYVAMHEAIAQTFGGERFVTGLLAELDLNTGRLTWISAGHPAPLLLRNGRVIKALEAPANLPLGVPFEVPRPSVAVESLEPADQILLFTDGFPEARLPDGELFGVERLGEFVEREVAAGQPAPETLRRLRRTLLTELSGKLRDDATALLVQWRADGEISLLPQTI